MAPKEGAGKRPNIHTTHPQSAGSVALPLPFQTNYRSLSSGGSAKGRKKRQRKEEASGLGIGLLALSLLTVF
ncbi:uncharacterized protein K444DRAFT_610666 [Hyaloscypha bicolor E]|uniref:Uncharacterized protein n=1 Tax=Hyaloscypha bicolor E TaxID=1095630 RepID=A0A2J6THY8_9HELO|nr:uncharacterized protein K444DRAFT_610666 [Hyaloscypha bicolor E]PMD62624.1 hypothetical protein K444DRAFT_610666 [Hyaloscypha bicolor E]